MQTQKKSHWSDTLFFKVVIPVAFATLLLPRLVLLGWGMIDSLRSGV